MSPGPARIPDFASTRISLMPGGTLNGIGGLSASVTLRKSLTIGAARWPPVASRPIWRGLLENLYKTQKKLGGRKKKHKNFFFIYFIGLSPHSVVPFLALA